MIYVASSIWLSIAVLMAWGVYRLWNSLFKAKALDVILLPGTLVAQLGRLLGLLITGAEIKENPPTGPEGGKPPAEPTPRYHPKSHFVGQIVVAFIPMVTTGIMIYFCVVRLGRPVLTKIPRNLVSTDLPASLSVLWSQLRDVITLAESTLNALRAADMEPLRIVLFTYLMICLTVRLAPIYGNFRGQMAAIAGLAGVTALIGTLTTQPAHWIEKGWPILVLVLGWLILLLTISLVARGIVSTFQMLSHSR